MERTVDERVKMLTRWRMAAQGFSQVLARMVGAGYARSMSEIVSHSFSNLVPLLVLLFVVFGVLILAAVILKTRIRKSAGAPAVKRTLSPTEMKAGDVSVVLGRTFHVTAAMDLTLSESKARWCCLTREDGDSRLLMKLDLSRVEYFPGQSELTPAEFPPQLERDGQMVPRSFEPVSLSEGWKMAVYHGPNDREFIVEIRDGKATLWKGKSIPPEGVLVLQEVGETR
jgi:hypothetical protein